MFEMSNFCPLSGSRMNVNLIKLTVKLYYKKLKKEKTSYTINSIK